MAIVTSTTGKNIALSYLINKVTTTENLVLKLFSNNIVPSDTDTATTYTEVSGGGYAAKILTGSTWTVTGGIASYTPQTFTFTGSVGNVYGYYVVRETTLDLVFAERFTSGPFDVQTSGDIITITLNLNLT